MLKAAKRKLGNRASVLLVQGDAAHLPFSSESFDIVTAVFTLEILGFEELASVLREVLRILRRGGRLLAISIHNRACRTVKLYKLLSRVFPTVFNCRPIELDKLLTRAGFRIARKHEARLYGPPIIIAVAGKE